ncbi:hypothetical protein SAMN02799624_00916 [Paenibacillus sp. UNC496MF]|uniref:hypothetical protein n=1 Tax=Paenibacillus sp. UNC496MF TaxID=1502753 RepID=UPI0008E0FE23|nr:hypothetical protein [Paenibacillus sp. UNC496MF]SFI41655.1 hypothetical protein SAMN02799624_00916 [Paenibacillus sp. UNC496MF]
MTTKSAAGQKTEREGNALFQAMKIAAWAALIIGAVLCLTNYSDFSDSNRRLMAGIGFLVGSVFIYMIGTAINLVHKRKTESE